MFAKIARGSQKYNLYMESSYATKRLKCRKTKHNVWSTTPSECDISCDQCIEARVYIGFVHDNKGSKYT